MPTQPMTSALRRASGLYGAMTIVMCGQGLLGTALGLRAEREHFATGTVSVVMAMYFVGFMLGARVTSWTIPRFGHRSTFVGLALLNAAVPLTHGLWVHPLPWSVGRLLTGLAMAGSYVVAESWLNDLASNENRGRMLAVYMVMSMVGVTLGQVVLNVASPDNFAAFAVAAGLFALGILPLVAKPPDQPRNVEHGSMSLIEITRLVPSGVVASALAGVLWAGLSSMSAVYASRVGFDTGGASVFVAAGALGTVVMSWPVNSWSDRRPRREVIMAAALLAAAIGVALVVLGPRSLVVYPLYLVFSGLTTAMYSLACVYTNDWLAPEQRVAATSALVLAVGIGSVLGPLMIGLAMSLVGPRGYYAALALTLVGLAGFMRYRIALAPDPVSA